jgi:hypothetical protein
VEPVPAPDAKGDPKKEEAVPNEFDVIIPELKKNGTITIMAKGDSAIQLQSRGMLGVECAVKPVRLRELLAIGRVLTGETRTLNLYAVFAPIFEAPNENASNAASIAAVTTLLTTIPHSEDEFVVLGARLVEIRSTVTTEEAQKFWTYMGNPEVEDTMTILLQMIANERDRGVDLVKALTSMFPQLRNAATPTPTS